VTKEQALHEIMSNPDLSTAEKTNQIITILDNNVRKMYLLGKRAAAFEIKDSIQPLVDVIRKFTVTEDEVKLKTEHSDD